MNAVLQLFPLTVEHVFVFCVTRRFAQDFPALKCSFLFFWSSLALCQIVITVKNI